MDFDYFYNREAERFNFLKVPEILVNGEEFVYQYERDKVASFSKSDVDRVQHLSKLQGDGLGYDISSIDENGNILRIEVKTTSASADSVFYMSRNEKTSLNNTKMMVQ